MFSTTEFIDEIISKLAVAYDAKGVYRASVFFEISQMLVTLKKGISEQKEAHMAEKQLLIDQIEALNKRFVEENENTLCGEKVELKF